MGPVLVRRRSTPDASLCARRGCRMRRWGMPPPAPRGNQRGPGPAFTGSRRDTREPPSWQREWFTTSMEPPSKAGAWRQRWNRMAPQVSPSVGRAAYPVGGGLQGPPRPSRAVDAGAPHCGHRGRMAAAAGIRGHGGGRRDRRGRAAAQWGRTDRAPARGHGRAADRGEHRPPYASRRTGVDRFGRPAVSIAHSCGHDMHVVWLWVRHRVLAENRDRWTAR